MKYKVIDPYNDAPEHPIKIEKGEVLKVVEQSDPNGPWPNWVNCKGIGKQGWVPKQILDIEGEQAVTNQDYYAKEHHLALGETLIAEYSLNGWIWGTKEGESDNSAWAPLNHLQKVL
ncbi:SH3 domain-containing protein [Vibrio sp. HN007]|uniref:SH3 domain-containing protein n=1 Tax=Vibrio iocasae TaxID=3098914 RepID=UPI0035D4D97B